VQRASPALFVIGVVTGAVAVSGCGASSSSALGLKGLRHSATPAQTALAWFGAVDARDGTRARGYFAPEARYMMDWGPTRGWSAFTHVRCRPISVGRQQAQVSCAFHESASPSEGQPSSEWGIDFRRAGDLWRITNYGEP
jgi:hypothetical protein